MLYGKSCVPPGGGVGNGRALGEVRMEAGCMEEMGLAEGGRPDAVAVAVAVARAAAAAAERGVDELVDAEAAEAETAVEAEVDGCEGCIA